MSYTARQLITDAYYVSGVLSRGLETPSGQDVSDGLKLLNDLLAIKTANKRLIPYFREYDLTAVVGQEIYFIPNLIDIESFTFNIGPVRYSSIGLSRKDYFSSGRVDNINALPFQWHTERTTGGMDLYIYFLPSDNFPLKIWGKFGFSSVPTLDTDLSTSFDQFYITYLKYGTAEYICAFNNVALQPQNEKILKEYEMMLVDISPKDLSMQKTSNLQKQPGFSWADVNLGRGYRPI